MYNNANCSALFESNYFEKKKKEYLDIQVPVIITIQSVVGCLHNYNIILIWWPKCVLL